MIAACGVSEKQGTGGTGGSGVAAPGSGGQAGSSLGRAGV